MSEHHTGQVETGAPIDYREHEKTYSMFINGAKYDTSLLVSLLIAMAVGFFTTAGFFGGVVLFFVLIISIVLLR